MPRGDDARRPVREAQVRGLATSREALLERIDTFVRQHLRNPELSIDLIAANLRCTKRNLHKVFSDRRETLSHYIRRQRLERCAADLANPELAGQSITELSYRWGFQQLGVFQPHVQGALRSAATQLP